MIKLSVKTRGQVNRLNHSRNDEMLPISPAQIHPSGAPGELAIRDTPTGGISLATPGEKTTATGVFQRRWPQGFPARINFVPNSQ
ncbi:MAG: hypothetical protein WBN22_12115 [Verrucomicrobiia bacterium]